MRKGFTLIELLAVIVILAIIALIATPLILNIVDKARKGAFKDSAYGIIKAAELDFTKSILDGDAEEITFTYANGKETASIEGRTLDYQGSKPISGTIIANKEGKVALAIHNGTYCAVKGFDDKKVVLNDKSIAECVITSAIGYTDYNATKGVNNPKLTSGMTPIKWNGSSWIDTTADDVEWYDYNSKKWANAKTADGSYWVWIPRYAYQISSNYHVGTTGNINIKFLIDNSNKSADDTVIESLPTYSANSQTNYIPHPAFTFGSDELTGFWMAKFEPTALEGLANNPSGDNVTTKTIKILPSSFSWRNITVGNAFTVSLNMQNNITYGWNADDVDTHLIKNIEWGAVTYLSKSKYGKQTEEIWVNPSNNYLTGCAGNSLNSSSTSGCLNVYSTPNGQKASTTGNVHGVYDMNGGAREYVSAYIDNGKAALTTNGNSIIIAESKYKDVYIVTTDNKTSNYENASTKKGDAIYETSNSSNSWYGDVSSMPYDIYPFFARSGFYSDPPASGPFFFLPYAGDPSNGVSFRPVLIVGTGL